MLAEKFDAYGEVLPDAARGKPETATAASARPSSVGQYAFWLLVVIIVSVRIIYYSEAPAFQVDIVPDVKRSIAR